LSQNEFRQHFGLGTATKMESAEIRRPNGKTETFQNTASDAIYRIVEGEGIKERKVLSPVDKGVSSGSLWLRERGYTFVSLEQAMNDKCYRTPDTYVGRKGLSWIHRWGLARGKPIEPEPEEPVWVDKLSSQPLK